MMLTSISVASLFSRAHKSQIYVHTHARSLAEKFQFGAKGARGYTLRGSFMGALLLLMLMPPLIIMLMKESAP
jgi:hypothetical protein